MATLIVIVVLHVGVFWVSRVIQPPKPRVVYMPQPQQQQQYNTLPVQTLLQAPPPLAPLAPLAPPTAPEVKLPTYDTPPANTKPSPPSALPPPIETRDPARS